MVNRLEGASEPTALPLRHFVGETVWSALVAQAFERSHPAGTVLLRQGEPGTHVLAVLSGVTKVLRQERSGEVALLAFRGPGELLGEMAVLEDDVRSATVEAMSRCVVAIMGKAAFLRFATEHDLFPVLVRYALARLRESDQARVSGAVVTRLAATLVRLADISGHPTSPDQPLELALTRHELAQHLRTSRNTITATLAVLESCQIEARRKRVVIHDLPALRRKAAELGT